jgi:hypothetical protein
MTTSIGIMSNYLKTTLLNHMLRGISYTMPYGSFHLTSYSSAGGAGDADTGTEKMTGYYDLSRVGIPLHGGLQVSGSTVSNVSDLSFFEAVSGWTSYGWGIKDLSVGGNLLFWGLWDIVVPVITGEVLRVGPGNLQINFVNPVMPARSSGYSGWTTFSSLAMANWVSSGSVNPFSWTTTGTQLALGRNVTVNNSSDNLFTSWTEVSGSGYSRQTLLTSAWSVPYDSICSNLNEIVFTDNASESWGAITDVMLYDSTGGSPIFRGNISTPVTVNRGDGFKIPIGGLEVQFE